MDTIGFPIKCIMTQMIAVPDIKIAQTGIPNPIPRHPKVKDKMPIVSA